MFKDGTKSPSQWWNWDSNPGIAQLPRLECFPLYCDLPPLAIAVVSSRVPSAKRAIINMRWMNA